MLRVTAAAETEYIDIIDIDLVKNKTKKQLFF